MFDFQDQRIIVTGGTRGIGAGITTAFLNAGAQVIATYRSNDKAANEFKENQGEHKKHLDIQRCDVSDAKQVKDFFTYLEEKYTSIEVLVNNAGIRNDQLTAMMEEKAWDDVVNANLKGTFLMSQQAVLKFMSNRYGRIVNISSIGGRLGLPGQANYSATKAGQIAFSKSLSKEVAKRGITINNVAPGFIATDFINDLPQEQLEEYKKTVPMKRFGKVEEVAHAVLFLADRNSAYITGATLEITGGL
ncbi:MAG: 3-oxoacyl-ACP reductase FabG [Bacteriovoracia bacterium]